MWRYSRLEIVLLIVLLSVVTSCRSREATQPAAQVQATQVASATAQPPPTPQNTAGIPTVPPTAAATAIARRLLRDVSLPAPPAGPPVQELLYSTTSLDESNGVQATFYAVSLGDSALAKRVIATFPGEGREEPVYGYLSPDGQFIAYLLDRGENQADLHVMRSDGSDDRFVVDRVFTVGAILQCSTYVRWSPDSTTLAIHRYNQDEPDFRRQQELGLYSLTNNDGYRPIGMYYIAHLFGWSGNDAVGMMVFQPLNVGGSGDILMVDRTGRATVLVDDVLKLPTACVKQAPDLRTVLLSIRGGSRQVSLVDGIVTNIPVTAAAAWMPDSTMLLASVQGSRGAARVVPIVDPRVASGFQEQTIDLFPADTGDVGFITVAPDGRYVALCDVAYTEATGVEARLRLYDVQADTWHVLERTWQCPSILGWHR